MRLLRVSALLTACLLMPCVSGVAQTVAGSTTSKLPASTSVSKGATKSAKAESTSVVNINTGTSADLDSLPQIGVKRSAKIIAGRPYKAPEDLVTKKVISQKLFDKLKARLTV